MGLDTYQVKDGNWNTICSDPESGKTTQNTSVFPKSFKTEAQQSIAPVLKNDFYSSTWFRALNDIRQSEKFMSGLEDVFWELKRKFVNERNEHYQVVHPMASEVIYEIDLGSVVPKSYFMEVRFNFQTDNIQLGIGQHI